MSRTQAHMHAKLRREEELAALRDGRKRCAKTQDSKKSYKRKPKHRAKRWE